MSPIYLQIQINKNQLKFNKLLCVITVVSVKQHNGKRNANDGQQNESQLFAKNTSAAQHLDCGGKTNKKESPFLTRQPSWKDLWHGSTWNAMKTNIFVIQTTDAPVPFASPMNSRYTVVFLSLSPAMFIRPWIKTITTTQQIISCVTAAPKDRTQVMRFE